MGTLNTKRLTRELANGNRHGVFVSYPFDYSMLLDRSMSLFGRHSGLSHAALWCPTALVLIPRGLFLRVQHLAAADHL
jgi:hypothetical protein